MRSLHYTCDKVLNDVAREVVTKEPLAGSEVAAKLAPKDGS